MEKETALGRQIKVRDELGRGWNRPGIGILWNNLVLVDSGGDDKLFIDPANYQISGKIKDFTKGGE